MLNYLKCDIISKSKIIGVIKLSNNVIWTFDNIENEQAFIGPLNKNINLLEQELDIKLEHINNTILALDSESTLKIDLTKAIIKLLYSLTSEDISWGERDLVYIAQTFKDSKDYDQTHSGILAFYKNKSIIVHTKDGSKIYPKTINQMIYYEAMRRDSIIFSSGSAGTGKTYLAVAYAVSLLKKNQIKRIIITRPVVEAGEKLGFLPGDLKEKVDPYLIPIYDALYEFFGKDQTEKYIEKGVIEIAPLAYMRGRTLDNAVIILDEAQNTTTSQMKMFVTRLGFNSKMIITGDITQIDLAYKEKSGLIEATKILQGIKGVSIVSFNRFDVMRHPLVSKIINRYEEHNL